MEALRRYDKDGNILYVQRKPEDGLGFAFDEVRPRTGAKDFHSNIQSGPKIV